MQSIGMPEWVELKLNTLFFRFIWKKKYSNTRDFEKVKRNIMCNDIDRGGLNMCNVNISQSTFLNWIEQLINDVNDRKEWTTIPLHNFRMVGHTSCFESNVDSENFKGMSTIYNGFWKKALSVWLNHNVKQQDKHCFYTSIIFNNTNIRYKGTLWLPECIKNGITRINQICEGRRLLTYNEFVLKYPTLEMLECNAMFLLMLSLQTNLKTCQSKWTKR